MNKYFVAWLTALFIFITPAYGAATLDKAVCSAADMAGGDPTKCTGAEQQAAIDQEINHLYDLGAPIAVYSSGTNDIIASTTPATTALVDGALYQLKPGVTNTGAVRLNLNSLGLISTVSAAGTVLSAGDLQSTSIYLIRYYAFLNEFRVLNSLGAGAVSTALPFVTIGNTAALSNERALTAGTGLGLTDGGANSTATFNITDAELTCILAQTSTADKISYWTGSGTCALADFSSAIRTMITTPSSASLRAWMSDEIGTGVLFFLGAPAGDDQVFVSSSTSAGAWGTLPDSDAAGTILGYDVTTNAWSTKVDDDVPESGDFGALIGGVGIDNTAGTLSLNATEVNSIVWGSGTFTTQVFDAGATDPTWTYASNSVGLTNAATAVFGNASSLITAGVAAGIQNDGTDAATASISLNEFNTTDATAFGLNFYKSGNAAIGSATVVANAEDLGQIKWYGAQQTGTFATENQAAGIRAVVGAAVTSGAGADMPGHLVFCTTPDASGTCTDRLTIDETGLSTFTAGITAAGASTIGNNAFTAGTVELANGTANTLSAAAGVLSIEGVAQVPATRTLTAGTGITTLGDLSANRTVAFDFSDAAASPAINADECRFTSNATVGGYIVCEGDTADTIETRIAITDPTVSDKTFTIPNADSNPVQPLTCSNTDRISAISSAGVVTCSHIVESLCTAASDETTVITTGIAKVTFRMPYAFTLTNIRGSLNTVSSSGSPIIDVNEAGTSVMTTNKVLIDVSEKTSVTAVTAVTITDPTLADDAEMTVDVDTAGTGAKGLKICLIGYQT